MFLRAQSAVLILRKTKETVIFECFEVSARQAVLILRKNKEAVIFECFEVSAQNAAVIATQRAFTRQFPAHVVSLSASS